MIFLRLERSCILYLPVILCTWLLGIGGGCSGKKGIIEESVKYVEEASQKQILLIGIGPDVETLDPHLASATTDFNVLRALFEGLINCDPVDLHPIPGLAESWNILPDRKTYKFHLRKNARWSNGDPVTAHDFVFAFKRALSPNLGSPMAGMFFVIQNATAYYQKKITDFNAVGVKAVDDYTLQIQLEGPHAAFLSILQHPVWSPLHEASLRKHGPSDRRDSAWARPGNLISNGAFYLKSRKVGEKITAVKNPHYWSADTVWLRAIHFLAIPNQNTEERLFRDNQLHITENVPYPQIMLHYQKKSPYLKIHPYLGTFYYVFNTTKVPFNDARVRKALTIALERDVICGTDRVPCKNRPAYNLVPEKIGGNYTPPVKIKEDITEAKRLLAEAGYANGQNFPKVTLLFNTSEGQRFIAEAIQEMWKKNLNIEVQLLNQEWKVLLAARKSRQFDIIRGSWVADYDDPETFLLQWLNYSPGNYSGWHSQAFEDLVTAAQKERDPEQRVAFFEKAEAIIMDEMPFIPIHASNTSHLVHSSVQGWYPNLLDWHPYTAIYLRP